MAEIASERGEEKRFEDANISSAQREDAQCRMKEKLYTALKRGRWEEVAGFYQNESVPTKMNAAGDTILHLAILMGNEDDAIELMNLLEKQDKRRIKELLKTRNDWGSTPLHQAAYVGLDKVCSFIANRYCTEEVVQPRNKRDETPLHVAVLHGHKKAFLALHTVIARESWRVVYRKNGGDTILHSAIFREHFDLALTIIKEYPEILHHKNEVGDSALHILARKPSAFKSGTHLSILDSFIYHSICLKEKQHKYPTDKKKDRQDLQDDHKACDAPWTNDDDDKFKNITDLESSVEGVKQRVQVDQQNTKIQNKGIPPGSPNQHRSSFNIFSQACEAIVLLLLRTGKGKEIQEMKKKNIYAYQIMEELVSGSTKGWQFESDGGKPKDDYVSEAGSQEPKEDYVSEAGSRNLGRQDSERENKPPTGKGVEKQGQEQRNSESKKKSRPEKASPFLLAAKRGVIEMVRKILEISPVAALDVDSDGKNIVLLAAEYRQTHIYMHIMEQVNLPRKITDTLFRGVDEKGNSALHLAAKFNKEEHWSIPGAAFQMQSEFKWYKSVEKSKGPGFFIHYNVKRKTAQEIFTSTHENLIRDARKWLTDTSQSCTVVAALIATVAYTSATTVPGGDDQNTGFPMFESQPAFLVFALSSLIALCSSVTALVLFLYILTSRFHESDFETRLPMTLIWGMSALIVSITTNLVSFCAGHFYIIHKRLKFGLYILYAGLSCPVMAFFFISQLPLYIDLLRALLSRKLERYAELHFF